MGENTQIMRKPLVLVAGDDVDQRKLIWDVLEEFGFRIVTAEDGKSAYDLFKKVQPDAIILDLQSGDYDGFDACEAIRNQEAGRETPIFMVTDKQNEDAIERAYKIGATDIVFKPVSLPVLPHRIRYALRTARSLSIHPMP
jgi:DNA-binding response OmpR family regulator